MPKLKAASDFIPSSRVAAGGDFAGDVAKPAKKGEYEHMSRHVNSVKISCALTVSKYLQTPSNSVKLAVFFVTFASCLEKYRNKFPVN